MTTLRCGVLVLLCSAAFPWTAHAADIILDGEAACVSIGGAWNGGTCTVDSLIVTVDRLVVPAGTRLYASSVGLAAGEVIIDGVLEVWGGSFQVTRSLLNRGELITYSSVAISGPMLNRGTWLNGWEFSTQNTVVNEWDFQNRGQFSAGMFINRGGVSNYTGWIFGLAVNEGLISNSGYLVISAVDNLGGIADYDGTTFNNGTARSRCGSAWYFQGHGPGFPGGPVGNPIEFDPCQPADALAAIGQSVLVFGQRGIYSKDDTIVFLRLLYRALKRLEAGLEAEAVTLLRTFSAEVYARIGYYPIGGSLILRAARAVELITNP
jgi:hypothetical protein